MTPDRYERLMADPEATLTQTEIDEGWRFCCEFDGLLIQKLPEKGKCPESDACTCN